jgi:hypothetical protein
MGQKHNFGFYRIIKNCLIDLLPLLDRKNLWNKNMNFAKTVVINAVVELSNNALVHYRLSGLWVISAQRTNIVICYVSFLFLSSTFSVFIYRFFSPPPWRRYFQGHSPWEKPRHSTSKLKVFLSTVVLYSSMGANKTTIATLVWFTLFRTSRR